MGARGARRICTARGGGDGERRKNICKETCENHHVFFSQPMSHSCSQCTDVWEAPITPGGSVWIIKISLCDQLLPSEFFRSCSDGCCVQQPGAASANLPLPAPAATWRPLLPATPTSLLGDASFCVNYTQHKGTSSLKFMES